MHNILHRALTDTALRDILAETREEWKLAQRGAVALMVNDDQYDAEKALDYWLNGFYFHDDDYKADALAVLPPIIAALSRNMMYSMVTDAVRTVVRTAWVIAHAQRQSGPCLIVPPGQNQAATPASSGTRRPQGTEDRCRRSMTHTVHDPAAISRVSSHRRRFMKALYSRTADVSTRAHLIAM